MRKVLEAFVLLLGRHHSKQVMWALVSRRNPAQGVQECLVALRSTWPA